ncbi:S41 family peptidase [Algoriphagus machipongonensis]|uniref:Tricorn protease homolog n=1 Tax=Algoriphagus machipongonensis TaxID=388413 RepID=A3HTX9_9BACT|nr:S41 family peptidase [Algoriphagus machipongonensis]EAZ81601.1 C- processing peptidase subfamily [Algoriphagus machipongonensis]
MRKLYITCLLVLSVFFANAQTMESPYFASEPTLTPDGDVIIFSYEGDLWKVPVSGGPAARITAMEGEETKPAVSPDGKWLAFTAEQYGNKDVFIMPLNGGEIQQLTFHEATDEVESWSWDSSTIYFTSSRYNSYTTFEIQITGATPKRLFPHYFNTVHNTVISPTTGEIFFNESWESKRFANRKRYKGEYNPDIKSYDPSSKAYKQYTDYEGKDFGATIDQNGKVYFMSDEANGEYNLYTFEGEEKTQLTDFPSSILWPKVSANGAKVVFQKDYQIHVYDVATGQTSKPQFSLYQNQTLGKDISREVAGNVSYFDVSPDGKKMAFVSRGVLFISDIKGKFIKKIPTEAKEAVEEVKWLADNKTLIYTRTVKGYHNLFTISAENPGEEKQLTEDKDKNRNLVLNGDRTLGVYMSGRNEVREINLETLESSTLVEDELWGLYTPNPYFSPDDQYIVFSPIRNFEREVMIYHRPSKKTINLTKTLVTETNPVWSPDGKYIYFVTDRTNPSYPYGTTDAHIYRMKLEKFDDLFVSDQVDELFAEKKEGDKEKEEKKVEVKVEEGDFMDRLELVGPSFGQQSSPYVYQAEGKTIVLYTSNHDEGTPKMWKTTYEDFERPKTEKVGDQRIGGFMILENKENLYLLASGKVNTFDPNSNKIEEIKLVENFSKNLKEEFEQMYFEAWAGMEQNFYDGDFHGENWQELRDRYAEFLPFIRSRANLAQIFNDMLGELNTSHYGFNSSGEEQKIYLGTRSMETGIIFENDSPYTVDKVAKDSPLDLSSSPVKPGDVLISVNGKNVDKSKNREIYFTGPSIENELELTFDRGGEEVKVKVHPTSYFAMKTWLYDEWMDTNEAYVDEKTGDKISYVHMKNMGGGELQHFLEYMVSNKGNREGLILDLRYNTGGNVHDPVLQFLSQRSYLQWKYRDGALTNQPNFSPADKPIVLLINEQSLSDAEMTAQGFKELGLGTIVGTETYRWIIFTSGQGLVDGSFYRLPSWGCYTLDGRNLEKEGVSPDIRVEENFVDRLEGNQNQLDKAIEVILEKLK